jgi:aspartyl aminopeptidase
VQKHDANHAPVLGGGVVLKVNSQKRYASDVFSSARFKLICEQSNVLHQTFVMRNDMPCGSTVGPAISATLGIPTVDIGEPMLSMHSIREMTAVKDHESMINLVSALFDAKQLV